MTIMTLTFEERAITTEAASTTCDNTRLNIVRVVIPIVFVAAAISLLHMKFAARKLLVPYI